MNRKLLTLLMLAVATSISAAEKIRSISETISGLKSMCAVNVYYTPRAAADATIVKIVGPDQMIEKISLEIVKGQLTVSVDDPEKTLRPKEVKVFVSAPALRDFQALSSGDIKCTSNIVCKEIEMTSTSSGDIEFLAITCDKATIAATSSGDIEVGKLQCKTSACITAASSGDIEVKSIIAETIKAASTSSGEIELEGISAAELTATATSSGEITLSGRTDKANLTATSSGDINAMKLRAAVKNVTKNSQGVVRINNN